MIRDPDKFRAWEDTLIANTPNDFAANLRWADEVLAFTKSVGAFPPADPWEGFEHKVRMARLINCSPNSFKELPKR